MADKVPASAGSTALAGDWQNTIPYVTSAAALASNTGVRAGKLREPDLVLPFQPANSANDIDDTNTYPLGTARRVTTFAWAPTSITGTVGVTWDQSTGVFTFATSAANQAGFLLVWFDVAGG